MQPTVKKHRFRNAEELDQFIVTTCDRAIDLMRDLSAESGQDLDFVAGLMLIPVMSKVLEGSENFEQVVGMAAHCVTHEPDDRFNNVVPLFD